MSRKRKVDKPPVRVADGWRLHRCMKCGGENYCPPGQSYCNNPDCFNEES
jgi:hypothetical protein